MQTKRLFLFLLASIFSVSTYAQNYAEQFAKCTEALGLTGGVDSIYLARIPQRDSCLVGTVAPDFTATSIDGKTIKLSKLKGQVVVLNFWFTKCPPCIKEMPALNQLAAYYAGKKVTFLSFATEDSAAVQTFLQEHPFAFTTVAKSEYIRRDIFHLFPVWPYTIIINQQGKISRMGSNGPKPGEDVFAFYRKAIDKLL